MALATDFPRNDGSDLTLRWSGQISLTRRILAVNIFALALLAGGFFYLDSYRSRIVDYRLEQAGREARLMAEAVGGAAPAARDALIAQLARDTGTRLRLFSPAGALAADSRALGVRNQVLVDPDKQDWRERSARWIDIVIDRVVGAPRPPLYRDRADGDWPDVRAARSGAGSASVWRAPDRTPVLTAADRLPDGGVLMTSDNARGITSIVRAERVRLGIVLGVVTLVSILLSLFLARTIVRPLRRARWWCHACHRGVTRSACSPARCPT